MFEEELKEATKIRDYLFANDTPNGIKTAMIRTLDFVSKMTMASVIINDSKIIVNKEFDAASCMLGLEIAKARMLKTHLE